jgi:hypothetical protein
VGPVRQGEAGAVAIEQMLEKEAAAIAAIEKVLAAGDPRP